MGGARTRAVRLSSDLGRRIRDLGRNGPVAGTCLAGPTPGAPCVSDVDCGASDACEMFQTDSDFAVPGDACAAPEPGFASGLGLGGLAFAASARRRVRPRD